MDLLGTLLADNVVRCSVIGCGLRTGEPGGVEPGGLHAASTTTLTKIPKNSCPRIGEFPRFVVVASIYSFTHVN